MRLILFLLIVFSNIIYRFIPQILLLDELFFLAIIVLSMFLWNRRKLGFQYIYIIILAIFIMIVGAISTIMYQYQTNIVAIMKDIVLFAKFPISFALLIGLKKDTHNNDKNILVVIKISTIIIFIAAIANLLFDIGMHDDIRLGIRSFQFLFTHPTFLVYSLVVFTLFLAFKKENLPYLLMIMLILITTMRDKAFAYIALYILVSLFYWFSKNKIKISKGIYISAAIVIFTVALMFSIDKIFEYISYQQTAARPALYIVGTKILINHFPLGSGFATFASTISGDYYSVLYSLYGIEFVDGLTQANYAYIADVFWPYIYGQFGIIGFILYIFIIMKIIVICVKNKGDKKYQYMLLILYLLMASTVEAVFTNDSGIFSVIILYLLMTNTKGLDSDEKNIDIS